MGAYKSFDSAACCRYMKRKVAILRWVHDRHLQIVLEESVQYLRDNPKADGLDLLRFLKKNLSTMNLPWWAVLIIKLALEALVQFLLLYLEASTSRRGSGAV